MSEGNFVTKVANHIKNIFAYMADDVNETLTLDVAPDSVVQPYSTYENNEIKHTIDSARHHFCTIVGKEYLFKVLAFHQSLQKNSDSFKLWICCIDEIAYTILSSMELDNVEIITLDKIEDKELLSVKEERKTNEYCWTLKAPLIQYVLYNYGVKDCIYCDSDIYFFSDPSEIYQEWEGYSIFLCPQRDLEWVENAYGKYQAGLIGFKNDENARKCLTFWRSKCLEWCSGTPDTDNNRFGDQKYLDEVPTMFEGVRIIGNLGIDAAPWNLVYNNDYNIYEKDSCMYVENYKLVAFHFACINIFNDSEFDLWNFNYIPIQSIIKNKIYLPYLTVVRECIDKIRSNIKYLYNKNNVMEAKTYYKYPLPKYRVDIEDGSYCFCTIVSKEYLIRGLTLYYSIKKNTNKFHFWMCCVDDISYSTLSNMELENVTLIPLQDIEDEEIRAVKEERNTNEFCWTLKAPLVDYILKNFDIDSVIYCDADLFFFDDPKTIFENFQGYYIYICRQRGTSELERVHGGFQAGFIGFKKEAEAFRVLDWWRKKCIEWCFDAPQPEIDRWGDQKYLDQIPMKFIGIKIENNLGINAAPWNVIFNNDYKIEKINDEVYVEDDKLILYHFGSMIFYNENEYDLWKLKPLTFNNSIIDNIYIPYINEVRDTIKKLKTVENDIDEFYSNNDINKAMNYFNTQKYNDNTKKTFISKSLQNEEDYNGRQRKRL
ncbi:MAG TPA: glycosyl transferase [Clostridiales bacterium]|nr:MAG: glycosyl transferase [Clostridiales bacterium GWD2_32_59]HAN10438.1 glycosyl transferase [Clostridiales bacterium]